VKDVRPTLGLTPKWTGPSFAEVLRSDSTTAAKTIPIVGDGRFWLRASLATPCELDLFQAMWHAEAGTRSAVIAFPWSLTRWNCWTKTSLYVRRVSNLV
jgi:hypothetical protein